MSNSMVTANGGGYSSNKSTDLSKFKDSYSTRDVMDYTSSYSSRDTKSYTSRDRNSYGACEVTKTDSSNGQESASTFQSSYSDSRSGKNRLERFEESLGKLNTPKWMASNTDTKPIKTSGWRSTSAESRYCSNVNTPPLTSTTTPTPTTSTTRYSYADYKRSCSAQRQNTGHATSYWKSSEYKNSSSSRPLSREPSPVPTWSRPPTAQGGGRFSRWSASTLSDSAYSGQNTPTDSVVSGRSMLDGGGGVTAPGYSRYQKPYLGWRSQENVATDSKCGRNTPNERLASSLRRSQQSGLDRTSPFGSLNSSLAGGYGQGATAWRGSAGSSFSRSNTPGPADWFVHDSIRSVSSAIAEFCKAEDVPAVPTSAEDKIRRRRTRTRTRAETEQQPKARLVWLESSFVSSTTNVNKNNSTQL